MAENVSLNKYSISLLKVMCRGNFVEEQVLVFCPVINSKFRSSLQSKSMGCNCVVREDQRTRYRNCCAAGNDCPCPCPRDVCSQILLYV